MQRNPLMCRRYLMWTIKTASVSVIIDSSFRRLKSQIHFLHVQFSDLIESRNMGIFSLLDEESKLPTHSFAHFTSEVHRVWNGHFRITLPRTSRLKAHRELRDDEGFVIRHYAGGVCYQTVLHLLK